VAKEGAIMQDRVKAALDKVRPNLQADGGDVQFVEVKDGIVKVKLTGACAGCPMSQMTLKKGIENFLKREIPEVKEVVSA
jgi:Fe-S cluster biogenesis protein NfuA